MTALVGLLPWWIATVLRVLDERSAWARESLKDGLPACIIR